jgi:hypothetical protein
MDKNTDTAARFMRQMEDFRTKGVYARSIWSAWRRYHTISRDLFEPVRQTLCTRCRRLKVFGDLETPSVLESVQDPRSRDPKDIPQDQLGAVQLVAHSYPEYIFPLGCDAVRYGFDLPKKAPRQKDYCKRCWPLILPFFAGQVIAEYRTASGRWSSPAEVLNSCLGVTVAGRPMLSLDRWYSAIRRHNASAGDQAADVVACGALWRPSGAPRDPHGFGFDDLLKAVRAERLPLSAIPWRRLEELVAELLRSRGMKVHLTPYSHDGGRDIIAMGELIPGEPTTLAVEVKQKSVVGVRDLRDALWANRAFPALLFVTSGRFSAGVIRERQHGGMGLRLLLKDGVGLRQWLDSYVSARMARKSRRS